MPIIAYTEIIMANSAEASCQALMAPYELTAWYGIRYWQGIGTWDIFPAEMWVAFPTSLMTLQRILTTHSEVCGPAVEEGITRWIGDGVGHSLGFSIVVNSGFHSSLQVRILSIFDNGDSNEPTERTTYEASAEALCTKQVRHMVGHHINSSW